MQAPMTDERYNEIKRLHRIHDLKSDEQFWSALRTEGNVSPEEFAQYHDEFTKRRDTLYGNLPFMAVLA